MNIVKICLVMEDSPLPRAIKQVLSTVGNESTFTYVEKAEDADLVIFTEVRDIERSYSKEKSYALLKVNDHAPVRWLPENCTVIGISDALVKLIELIGNVHMKIQDRPTAHDAVISPEAPAAEGYKPDALRILVIDDKPKNITSAKSGLAAHRLTTTSHYRDAMDILGRDKFDVVLTDLHMPMSSQTMGDKFRLGELVPYGILLMVEAARQGARHVAVVTDLSHHDDPFSAAFDHYSQFPVKIEGATVVMMHAPMKDGAKDWAAALEQLTKTS